MSRDHRAVLDAKTSVSNLAKEEGFTVAKYGSVSHRPNILPENRMPDTLVTMHGVLAD